MAAGIWQPTIYRPDFETAKSFLLPCPIQQFRAEIRGQQKEHYVPLRQTLLTYGLTNAYREVTISGLTDINDNPTNPETSQDEMDDWDLIETLEEYALAFNVAPGDGFELGWYRKTGAGAFHRRLKDCVTVGLAWDIGDDQRKPFAYSLSIIARDPEIYTTALGS